VCGLLVEHCYQESIHVKIDQFSMLLELITVKNRVAEHFSSSDVLGASKSLIRFTASALINICAMFFHLLVCFIDCTVFAPLCATAN
jgi:hypothetical protein